jgi:hypothetical protein
MQATGRGASRVASRISNVARSCQVVHPAYGSRAASGATCSAGTLGTGSASPKPRRTTTQEGTVSLHRRPILGGYRAVPARGSRQALPSPPDAPASLAQPCLSESEEALTIPLALRRPPTPTVSLSRGLGGQLSSEELAAVLGGGPRSLSTLTADHALGYTRDTPALHLTQDVVSPRAGLGLRQVGSEPVDSSQSSALDGLVKHDEAIPRRAAPADLAVAVLIGQVGGVDDQFASGLAAHPTTLDADLDLEIRRCKDPVELIALSHSVFCTPLRVHEESHRMYKGLGRTEQVLAMSHALRNIESRLAQASGRMGSHQTRSRRQKAARSIDLGSDGASGRGLSAVDRAVSRAWWTGPALLSRHGELVGRAPQQLQELVAEFSRLVSTGTEGALAVAALPSAARLSVAGSLSRMLRRGFVPPHSAEAGRCFESLIVSPALPATLRRGAAVPSSEPALGPSSTASAVAAGPSHVTKAVALSSDVDWLVSNVTSRGSIIREQQVLAQCGLEDLAISSSSLGSTSDSPSRALIWRDAGSALGAQSVVQVIEGSAAEALDTVGGVAALSEGLAAASLPSLRAVTLLAEAAHRCFLRSTDDSGGESRTMAAASLSVVMRSLAKAALSHTTGDTSSLTRVRGMPLSSFGALDSPSLDSPALDDAVALQSLLHLCKDNAHRLSVRDLCDVAAASHALLRVSGGNAQLASSVADVAMVAAEESTRLLAESGPATWLRAALGGTGLDELSAMVKAETAGEVSARVQELAIVTTTLSLALECVKDAVRLSPGAEEHATRELMRRAVEAGLRAEPAVVASLATLPLTTPGTACSDAISRCTAQAARTFASIEAWRCPPLAAGSDRSEYDPATAATVYEASALLAETAAVTDQWVELCSWLRGAAVRLVEAPSIRPGSLVVDIALRRLCGSDTDATRGLSTSSGAWNTLSDVSDALSVPSVAARHQGDMERVLADAAALIASRGASARRATGRLLNAAGEGVSHNEVLACSLGAVFSPRSHSEWRASVDWGVSDSEGTSDEEVDVPRGVSLGRSGQSPPPLHAVFSLARAIAGNERAIELIGGAAVKPWEWDSPSTMQLSLSIIADESARILGVQSGVDCVGLAQGGSHQGWLAMAHLSTVSRSLTKALHRSAQKVLACEHRPWDVPGVTELLTASNSIAHRVICTPKPASTLPPSLSLPSDPSHVHALGHVHELGLLVGAASTAEGAFGLASQLAHTLEHHEFSLTDSPVVLPALVVVVEAYARWGCPPPLSIAGALESTLSAVVEDPAMEAHTSALTRHRLARADATVTGTPVATHPEEAVVVGSETELSSSDEEEHAAVTRTPPLDLHPFSPQKTVILNHATPGVVRPSRRGRFVDSAPVRGCSVPPDACGLFESPSHKPVVPPPILFAARPSSPRQHRTLSAASASPRVVGEPNQYRQYLESQASRKQPSDRA